MVLLLQKPSEVDQKPDAGEHQSDARDEVPVQKAEFDIMVMGVTGSVTIEEARDLVEKQFVPVFERCVQESGVAGFSFVFRISITASGVVKGQPTMVSLGSGPSFACAAEAAKQLESAHPPYQPVMGGRRHTGIQYDVNAVNTIDLDLTLALPSK